MGKFLPISLSLTALAFLAACGSDPVPPAPAPVVIVPPPAVVTTPPPPPTVVTVPPAPTVVTAPPPTAAAVPSARPGFGRIETLTVLPTASAGGTAASSMQRLNIKMEDGTMQWVDTTATGLAAGDRIEITREGYLRR
jgi:hypothetical protein